MAIRDKAAAFLKEIIPAGNPISTFNPVMQTVGSQVGPTIDKIGSMLGTAVAGNPGLAQMAVTPSGVAHRVDIPPTTGLLGAVGLPQAAHSVQYHMQKPQVARAVGAGVVGAGALGLGAAGAALLRKGKEKARMAGRDLGTQLGVQMPIVY